MIFDCFPFFNELDTLEIRLNELDKIVDFFILSEATKTFTGKDKPLYYQENKDRYSKFNHKILHVVINSYDGMDTANSWSMDRGQKQKGIDYLQNNVALKPTDIVILSDCDEIPKASTIKNIIDKDWDRMSLKMSLFYYYINCKCNRSWSFGQIIRPTQPIKSAH